MKWKDIRDNFGRRSGGDRRKKSVPGIEEDRRSGEDRRKSSDRRSKVERRQSEDPDEVDSKFLKKRSIISRRDIIFGEDE